MKYNALIKAFYTQWRRTDFAYVNWAKKEKISYYKLLILYSLCMEETPYTQKQLCQEWSFPKQTIHSILHSLHEEGMLYFYTSEKDQRQKDIVLSEKGKAYALDIVMRLQKLEEKVIQQIGEEAMREWIATTRRFNEAFEEEMRYE